MKAAPITKKPSFPLMKQGDIQNIYHLQMPRWLFTDPRYIGLSLEAKVTYTFFTQPLPALPAQRLAQ
ncbi:MAG: hypothetical protein ACLSAF_20440 [Intestinimonas sp.]